MDKVAYIKDRNLNEILMIKQEGDSVIVISAYQSGDGEYNEVRCDIDKDETFEEKFSFYMSRSESVSRNGQYISIPKYSTVSKADFTAIFRRALNVISIFKD